MTIGYDSLYDISHVILLNSLFGGPLAMQLNRTMKSLFLSSLALALLFSSALPGYAQVLVQRDWMILLVDTLAWSYGLPDEPQDSDYIKILSGNRKFLFEAEDYYARQEDNVSETSLQTFGPFSGRGWLNGTRVATEVHLSFTLPIDGEYLIQAGLRQAGHRLLINGIEKSVDGGPGFTLVTVGNYQLQAGPQEIVVTLPPNGSIDYLTLKAPGLATIAPSDGWEPDEPLSWSVIQTTLLQLFELAELFPRNPKAMIIEAEDLDQNSVKVVSTAHLGRATGGKWLRADLAPVEVLFPFKLSESGFYDVTLRTLGNPVNVSVDGHHDIVLDAKTNLDDYTFEALFFFAGDRSINVKLPPGGGVDSLSLNQIEVDPALTDILLGQQRRGEPGVRDLDTLSSLLAAFGVNR